MALFSALILLVGGVPATTAASVQPFGIEHPSRWKLVFQDNFDGTELNDDKWANGYGWGNTARNSYGYCDPDNNEVAGGALKQTIERRPQDGELFSTGCVHTKDLFSQLYGFWEARIRMPGCRGSRGAFWGKPNDESWPPELDVIEVYGDERDRADLTNHWMERGDRKKDKERFYGPDFSADYHVFGARWSEEEIVWYVDGVERMRTKAGSRFMNDGGPFYAMVEAQTVREDSTCGVWPYYSSMYTDYVRMWADKAYCPD